jgi:hypothetical protein
VDFDAPTREGAQLLPDDKVGYHAIYHKYSVKTFQEGANHLLCYVNASNVHYTWFPFGHMRITF